MHSGKKCPPFRVRECQDGTFTVLRIPDLHMAASDADLNAVVVRPGALPPLLGSPVSHCHTSPSPLRSTVRLLTCRSGGEHRRVMVDNAHVVTGRCDLRHGDGWVRGRLLPPIRTVLVQIAMLQSGMRQIGCYRYVMLPRSVRVHRQHPTERRGPRAARTALGSAL